MKTIEVDSEKKNWKQVFFTIWTGQAFSLLGSQLVSFALIWYLTQQTGSAVVLATASLMTFLPTVFLGPISGALVDRWNRRYAMIFADGAIALSTLCLAVLFAMNRVQIWEIYLILFLRSIGQGIHNPAMLASTPLMVPGEQLTRIQGLNQALEGAMNILSAPFGAFLLGVLPMQFVLSIDIVTALLAIAPLCFINIPQPKALAGSGAGSVKAVLGDLQAGFRYVFSWTGLALIIGMASLINLLTNPAFALFPLFVKDHLGGGAMQLGWLNAIMGVGVILGGLILGVWGGFKRRIATAMFGLAGLGFGLLIMGMLPGGAMLAAFVAMFLLGIAMPVTNGPIFALIQATVEPEMQGRVITLLISLAGAVSPLGLAVAGPLAQTLGIQAWFLGAGLLCLLMSGIAWFVPAVIRLDDGPQVSPRAVSQTNASWSN
jgi:DHA3 family macrolide efflux protein-like MFS transporter